MDRRGPYFHFLPVFFTRDLASTFCWLKQNGLLLWFDFLRIQSFQNPHNSQILALSILGLRFGDQSILSEDNRQCLLPKDG